jgi:putative transposase
MTSDSTVVPFRQAEAIDDPLTAILRSGARRLLAQAIEAEAEAFLAAMKGVPLSDGRERLVRHGHGPERQVQTGIGPVAVRRVKLRDRGTGEAVERIRFTSSILPRWARRTPSLDALLPVLYLRGVSMGDFQEALGALLGKDAPNLSPSVVARLRGEWEADHARWQRRDLSARRYVYLWADGVYLQARMEPQAECPTTKTSRGHAGADRRYAGGQERAGRLPGWPAREHAELARAAGRPQGAWLGDRPGTGHRRRGARLLEGARAGLAHDPASALYGA